MLKEQVGLLGNFWKLTTRLDCSLYLQQQHRRIYKIAFTAEAVLNAHKRIADLTSSDVIL